VPLPRGGACPPPLPPFYPHPAPCPLPPPPSAGGKPTLIDFNFDFAPGTRTLLIGENGTGKSTLLRILAGNHLARGGGASVTVLGREAYFDTSLNELRAYCGTDWGRRAIAFQGHTTLTADIGVSEMMAGLQAQYPARRDELVELLGVDPKWRMHQLSDGQRRRVQIMLQLLRPVQLLLLDEITTDLDLITRQDFLKHLQLMSERDGVTVVYATHIFDGLDDWPTHIAQISEGRLARCCAAGDVPELAAARAAGIPAPLLRTIESWMRAERAAKVAAGKSVKEVAAAVAAQELRGGLGNGYLPGRIASQGGRA
jgi:CCR4-NOT complex subunit CAF16